MLIYILSVYPDGYLQRHKTVKIEQNANGLLMSWPANRWPNALEILQTAEKSNRYDRNGLNNLFHSISFYIEPTKKNQRNPYKSFN